VQTVKAALARNEITMSLNTPLLPALTLLGNAALLQPPTLATFCSSQAPAGVLLHVHDLAQRWRHEERVIMSGFQSIVEQEALTVLLTGTAPVVVWLARSMVQQPPAPLRAALAAQRLLLVSPFPAGVRRQSTATAQTRNRLCAHHADVVLIAHAAPGGKVEALALELLAAGKHVYTLDHPANASLVTRGAEFLTD
jgi:predicted Rossmann fold nucleotide-binding protein DprA/Smf involved in DNA uptake